MDIVADFEEEARKRGFEAGKRGVSRLQCPYPSGTLSLAWLVGYQEGELAGTVSQEGGLTYGGDC